MRLFFSVGEPSGDQHAAHLIAEFSRRFPDFRAIGYGGPLMERAGCRIEYPLANLALMGIGRILPHLATFIRLVGRAKTIFRKERPDAVILIDYPGFNWHIAKAARKLGIPVYYYCPPQMWAWAGWRIKKMKRDVDHALCVLPFEAQWYQEKGMPATYVGHPFYDDVKHRVLDQNFLESHRKETVIGILPGSRDHEVEGNFPIQLKVVEELAKRNPGIQFHVAAYKESHRELCHNLVRAARISANIICHVGKTSEIIETSKACLMVSGSVSLELLARKKPAVVLYHCSRTFYWLARLLVRCKYMTLPNLFANRALYPEFALVGDPGKAIPKITETLDGWLNDDLEYARVIQEITNLAKETVIPGAISKTANVLTELLTPRMLRAA